MPNTAPIPEIPRQLKPEVDHPAKLDAEVITYLNALKHHYGDIDWCINQIILAYKAVHPLLDVLQTSASAPPKPQDSTKATGKVAANA